YTVRVPPPHPHEALAPEELLDHLAQGEVEDVSEVSMNYDVTVESLDQNPIVGRDRCARGSMGLYLFDDSAYSVRVRGPYSRELLDDWSAGLVFVQQPIDLFSVFSDSDCESAWHGEYLPVPSRNGRGGIVDG